jgi:carbamate kinase
VLELEAVRALLEAETMVVAVGGGGIPVVRRDGRHDGIDAVIDKDLASALLATDLGARRLVILTQVPVVYRGFGTHDESPIRELRPGRDEGLLESFPAGSMRPKVEAAFAFVAKTGGEALITSADAIARGEAGTRIVPASRP